MFDFFFLQLFIFFSNFFVETNAKKKNAFKIIKPHPNMDT